MSAERFENVSSDSSSSQSKYRLWIWVLDVRNVNKKILLEKLIKNVKWLMDVNLNLKLK
jgi:hypothetical protein